MPYQIINPPDLLDSVPRGFSQVISAGPGELVFIAGQAGADATPKLVSKDFGPQVDRALDNLGIALRAAGLEFRHVVQAHTFVVGLNAERLAIVHAAEHKIWGDRPPTQSLIGIAALAHPEALFEIDAIAVRF